ncbi:MAG: protein phosphatase 2C domain-containing protein [Bacteroidales bacterium]|nr:protein phosphatase 2C domain-containing protein [Bacteroidales bacterium]
MRQLNTSFPLTVYADSRQGGRRENQDSCAWGDTPAGFLVTVCDGMGGGPSGKEASSLAVHALLQYIQEHGAEEKDRSKLMREAIENANKVILDAVEEDSSKKGMGTTLTALLINDQSAIVAHMGDSRVYQFRRGFKHFRTNDHSLVFAKLRDHEIKSEEEARTHPDSNIILRALGINTQVKPEIVELAYEKGDRFMLCTDGIWGMFPEKTITAMAARTPVLSGAVETLVVRVDEEGFANGGGHDNLTLAMVETKTNSKMQEKMSTRQKTVFLILAAVCLVSLLLNVILLVRNRPGRDAVGPTQMDSLVYVVSGLKNELEETQERLKLTENQHAQFVDEMKNVAGGDKGKVAERLEQEQASIDNAKKEREDLKKELTGIIGRTEKLAKMSAKEGSEATLKEAEVKAVRKAIETFAGKAGKKDSPDVKKVLEWLDNPIAKQDDVNYTRKKDGASTAGHYKYILDGLKRILNSI